MTMLKLVPFDLSKLSPLDTYISYLPAAHSFEQALLGIVFCFGMKCGFFGGDPLKLLAEDLPLLKPTFFPSVPRVYNKIYGTLQAKIKELTGLKACLVNQGVATKTANYKRTGQVTHCFYDIIFKKFKAALGGRVRLMITGSASMSAEVTKQRFETIKNKIRESDSQIKSEVKNKDQRNKKPEI